MTLEALVSLLWLKMLMLLQSSCFSRYFYASESASLRLICGQYTYNSLPYSAMCIHPQAKVHDLAGDEYRTSVLGPIKEWIQVRLDSHRTITLFWLFGDS